MSKTSGDFSDVTLKRKRNAKSKSRGSSARRGDMGGGSRDREELLDKTSSSNIEEGDSP